jgi:hypothetical protein
MRFFNLARPGGRPVEESDAGGQLFVQAHYYVEVGPGVFTPAPLLEKQIGFDSLVAAVADRLAVMDAAAAQELREEKAAAKKAKVAA